VSTPSPASFRQCSAAFGRWFSGVVQGPLTLLLFGLLIGAGQAGAQQTGAAAPPSTGRITGRVTEAGATTTISATQIHLVGTRIGTLSATNGTYQILNVAPGTYQITAERLGYKTVTRPVTVRAGQASPINFELAEAVLALDEIVVTGEAGQARKREVGTTISQISVAAKVAEPTKSVESLLQGRATGLVVAENAGAIGGGAQIRLRGNSSITMSNQPLIYVDGTRIRSEAYPRNNPNSTVDFTGRSANVTASPLNDINPNDIERIEVIKGAAATALYGTEASGGVIQIFTKRGKEGTTRWNLRMDQGFRYTLPFGPSSDPFMRMDPWMRGAPSFLSFLNGGLIDKAKSRFTDPNSCLPSKLCADFTTGTSGTTPITTPATYSYPGAARQQSYFLSGSGGLRDITYFISGGTEDNLGILPLDNQKRYSLRGNFSFDPGANFKIQWNTSFNQDNHNQTRQGGDVQGMTSNAYRGGTYVGGYTYDNFNALLNQTTENHIGNVTTSLTLQHAVGDRFSNRFVVGISRSAVELRGLRPFGFRYQPAGALSQKTFLGELYTLDYAGSYRQKLSKSMGLLISYGGQAVDSRDKTIEGWSQNFPGPGEPTMDSGGFSTTFEERIRVINAGFFGQARFDMWDRLFLTAALRVDGNSAFGQSLGLQPYPKLSASYVISDESFWPKTLGTVKLRAAVGEAGRAPGAFDAIRTWNPSKFGTAPGFLPRNLGNADLGPERKREYEAGFEASVLNNRLTADMTYYYQKVRNALLAIPLPGSEGGWNAQLENVGLIENKGLELTLNGNVFRGKKVEWDLGLGISTNHNKLLSQGDKPDAADLRVGYPVPAVYGTMIMNRRDLADPILVKDTVFGPNQPTLILQPSTSIRLPRGITVSARGEYQGGFYVRDSGWSAGAQRTEAWPTCLDYPARIGKGDKADIEARYRAFCNYGIPVDVNLFVFDATFFKLRDVTVQFPVTRFIPKSNHATLALSLRNAFRWVNSDWLELDPEMIGRSSSENTRGITESMPPQASFTASIQVSF
jgi:TonB-linked SusC/RagA family outer membrane protein